MTIIYNNLINKNRRRYLRSDLSYPERILWQYLKNKQLKGYKFRRQHGIGFYIVDFYCPRAKLVVEIDGDSHCSAEAIEYDERREKYIELLGIKVLRFTNYEVNNNLDTVIEKIVERLP